LYVDLLEGGTRFTPITIDPDVGYPGGNTVDGGGPVPTSGHGHRDGHDGDQDSPEA
jgi:hypothetical protein